MPYWLESDTFADDPAFGVLAKGKLALEDALRASYCNLKAKASLIRKDGYLTEAIALAACRGRRKVLELLCTPVLEQPPMVHRRGDKCPCLGDAWIDGYDLRIHEYLKRNPSRAENDREKAKRADRRNAALKAMVYKRDGGCCRYCRSGPLSPKAVRAVDRRRALQFDHVDPDRPAGLDGANYATACGACNEYKGERTPYEAGMVLLPPPTPEQAREWLQRPLQLHNRPEYDPAELTHTTDANQRPNSAETTAEQRHDADPDSERTTDRRTRADRDPNAVTTANHAHDQADHDTDQPQRPAENRLASGRVGHPADGGPGTHWAQPPRDSAHPDIYTRRGRPTATPGAPPQTWPPESAPAASPRLPAGEEDRG